MDRGDHLANGVLLLFCLLLCANLVTQRDLPLMLPLRDPRTRLERRHTESLLRQFLPLGFLARWKVFRIFLIALRLPVCSFWYSKGFLQLFQMFNHCKNVHL